MALAIHARGEIALILYQFYQSNFYQSNNPQNKSENRVKILNPRGFSLFTKSHVPASKITAFNPKFDRMNPSNNPQDTPPSAVGSETAPHDAAAKFAAIGPQMRRSSVLHWSFAIAFR
jgi:hypothetical protein